MVHTACSSILSPACMLMLSGTHWRTAFIQPTSAEMWGRESRRNGFHAIWFHAAQQNVKYLFGFSDSFHHCTSFAQYPSFLHHKSYWALFMCWCSGCLPSCFLVSLLWYRSPHLGGQLCWFWWAYKVLAGWLSRLTASDCMNNRKPRGTVWGSPRLCR